MLQAVTEMVCQLREELADRVGPEKYKLWFGDTIELRLEGNRLILIVLNTFVGNWISNNFMTELVGAGRCVLGVEPQVEIRVVRPAADENRAPSPRSSERPTSTAIERATARPPGAAPRLRGELDAFVVGPANELAYSAACSVVRAPGEAFKHLVLHGRCGLGKTHLLQGMCNGLTRAHPGVEWTYLSAEEFTNEFVYAMKINRVEAFRARFRRFELLLLDDVHFLANKKATQEEFLHTFNAIDAAGRAVIMSSDRHPKAIVDLTEALQNRLAGAMVVEIAPPDYSTRRTILEWRARRINAHVPEDVLDLVARSISRNVRELEGALYKLTAVASLARQAITLDLARRVLEEYFVSARPIRPADIERAVAQHFGLSPDALRSKSRDRVVSTARALAMYLIRRHTSLSFPEIGRQMAHKNHSTVLMAVRRMQELLDRDGAVVWKTPAGQREMPLKRVLAEIEPRISAGHDA